MGLSSIVDLLKRGFSLILVVYNDWIEINDTVSTRNVYCKILSLKHKQPWRAPKWAKFYGLLKIPHWRSKLWLFHKLSLLMEFYDIGRGGIMTVDFLEGQFLSYGFIFLLISWLKARNRRLNQFMKLQVYRSAQKIQTWKMILITCFLLSFVKIV